MHGMDDRRAYEQQSPLLSRHREERRHTRPEQMVTDSIYKAFHRDEPPPAHSKAAADKVASNAAVVAAMHAAQYPSAAAAAAYAASVKESKLPPVHRQELGFSLLHEKPSVIVQPDPKFDKSHSISPKQRVPGRASPYQQANLYKSYEVSQSPHRGSSGTPHNPVTINPSHSVPSTHSIELAKARQSHPATTSSAHHDRYYSSKSSYSAPQHPHHTSNSSQHSLPPHHQTNSSSRASLTLVQNSHHSTQVKGKSPPQHVYSHPDPRPYSSQHAKGAPPPAHSNKQSERAAPLPHPPALEARNLVERGAPLGYPPAVPSPHHKILANPVNITPPLPRPTPATVHPTHPLTHITQTQPLDLGTRDETASPSKRRTHTPTPQDAKKPRIEGPFLSKVSEPSPLYPSSLTTITPVENVAAHSSVNNSSSRVNSPAPANSFSRPPSHPSLTPSGPDGTNSPVSAVKAEPDKSSSPGPSDGPVQRVSTVHKLKKQWLQRHESGAETAPSQGGSRPATPPTVALNGNNNGPKSPALSIKSDDGKTSHWKPKNSTLLPNGHSQDPKDSDSSTLDSDDDCSLPHNKAKRSKNKRTCLKRPKKGSDSNSESDKESDGSETSSKKSGGRVSSKQEEPKRRGRKPKKVDKEEGSKPKKMREELDGDPLKKPPLHQLKKTGESFLQDGSCFEVSSRLPKCRECRWTAHQRNKKMPNIFCRFYAFRRLRYTKNGQLAVAGFSDPVKVSVTSTIVLNYHLILPISTDVFSFMRLG